MLVESFHLLAYKTLIHFLLKNQTQYLDLGTREQIETKLSSFNLTAVFSKGVGNVVSHV